MRYTIKKIIENHPFQHSGCIDWQTQDLSFDVDIRENLSHHSNIKLHGKIMTVCASAKAFWNPKTETIFYDLESVNIYDISGFLIPTFMTNIDDDTIISIFKELN